MNASPAHADTAIRLTRVAGELWPTLKAYLRLLRAETDLATESLPALVACAAIAGAGACLLLAALVAGAVVGLVQAGWSLPAAVGIVAGPACVITVVASAMAYQRLQRLTLPQTRRRVRVLLEILDDD